MSPTEWPTKMDRSSRKTERKATFSASDGSATVVTEMALCEVSHIFLRPGQLYRFVVMPGCKACEDAAAPYSPNTKLTDR